MNIKNILLSATIAAGSIFGAVAPAEARPSLCWNLDSYASSVSSYRCDVTRHVDSKGTWWSINNSQKMIRLYDDGTAQVWLDGGYDNNGSNWYFWNYDEAGDIRIEDARTGKYLFSFRR